jgi:hypothetical protein
MKSKSKLRLLKKKEIETLDKSYEEILQEIRDLNEGTAAEYVPKLCVALKRKNPLITAVQIRATVINDLCPSPWTEKTVRGYWPEWLKNPKLVEHGKISRRAQIASSKSPESYGKLSTDDIDKEEEQSPVESSPIWEYEDTHPKTEETPFEAIGEINRAIARLWTALTGKKDMAHMEDDIKKEHIIPTRERFKDIVNGSSKVERDFLFNWLTWLNQVIKDRIDIIDKSDETAYDTRE